MEINEKFYRLGTEGHPKIYTVGELKEILGELPDDLPIKQGFGDGVMLIVYNHDDGEDHLEFEEIEDYGEDDY